MRASDGIAQDAHIIEQGKYAMAVNECCVVQLDREAPAVKVSFMEYRWHLADADRVAYQAEQLRKKLGQYRQKRTSAELIVAMATECMLAYRRVEEAGWLSRIEPSWEHDCEHCIFLGPMQREEGDKRADGVRRMVPQRTDLFYCPENKPYPTVVARFGATERDIYRGLLPGLGGLNADLYEAARRAKSMGLLDGIQLPPLTVLDNGTGGMSD